LARSVGLRMIEVGLFCMGVRIVEGGCRVPTPMSRTQVDRA
jgi:hypothetical protein